MKSLILLLVFATAAHADPTIEGYYQVPVPKNLQKFATYKVDYVLDPSQGHLTFALPTALVGETKVIEMKLTKDNIWIGDHVQAKCEDQTQEFRCRMRFNDLNINPKKVRDSVRKEFRSGSERSGRMQVARRFEGEPIGILIYKKN